MTRERGSQMKPGDRVILQNIRDDTSLEALLASKYLKQSTLYKIRKVHHLRFNTIIGLIEVPGLLFDINLFRLWKGGVN